MSPRLLYLVHRVPYPPDKGDRIRAFHVLRFLSNRADVDVACLADEPVGSEFQLALERYCRRLAVVPVGRRLQLARGLLSLIGGRSVSEGAFRSAALRRTIRQWAGQTCYDAVLVSASSMVPYLWLPELVDTPKIVDLVDVDSEKWFDYAAASRGVKRWFYGLEGRRLRRLEADLPRWVRGVTLVSEAEAALYRDFCAAGRVQTVGNGVDLDYFRPRTSSVEAGCVFVGALDYLPNVEGVNWFCREVWPGVRATNPQAKLFLVGRRPAAALHWTAKLPGVELVGQVPDVRPYLARAAVAVVPLQIARGVQNKVLEALAMGKAVVASPACLKGLPLQPGVHVQSAATADEWRRSITQLLHSPALRQELGVAGRRFVEDRHHWETCLSPLADLLDLPTRTFQANAQTPEPAAEAAHVAQAAEIAQAGPVVAVAQAGQAAQSPPRLVAMGREAVSQAS